MAMATLGFQIDSSPASAAAANLDELTASAGRTTVAVDKLETEAATLGTSLGKTGRGAREAQAPVESLGRTFGTQDDHVRAFRMEVERLTAKFQPAAAATKSYEATVSEIERAHRMGVISATQMQRALDAERMAYERLKTSATTAGAAMKAANMNGAKPGGVSPADAMLYRNLAFQANQIGQQGAVTGNYLQALTIQLPDIMASFGSLPLVLAGGVTAVAASMLPLGDIMRSILGITQETTKDLEKQADIILTVADRWGDAVPELREYANELVRAKEAAEDASAVDILKADILRDVKKEAVDVTLSISDLVMQLQSAGEETEVILALQRAFSQFKDAAESGKLTLSEVTGVQDALSTALNSTGIPAISGFREEFDKLAESATGASIRVEEIINKMAGLNGSPLGTLAPLFSENGRLYSPEDFMPFGNAPVPRPRPNIELNGDGSTAGPAMILNSDGRLVPVPTPGARPNAFDQQVLTTPAFNSTRTGDNAWDRSILLEEARRNEMGAMFKGFITDFGSVLRESGGDLGKALMQSLSNAMMNAASQAWDKFASLVSNALVNAIMGGPSAGLLNKGIGFTGATTTLGDMLGAGGGLFPANQNVAGMAGANSGVQGQVWNFFANKGLAPHQVAGIMGNVSAESGFNPSAVGDSGNAFGLFQHWGNRGGGPSMLGNTQAQLELAWKELQTTESGAMSRLLASTDVRGATAAFAGFERPQGFSLGNPEGAHNFIGRLNGAEEALSRFGGTTTAATQGLGQLGNGLGQMGNTLASGATGAANGGGGGLFGWLGSLFGGGGGSQWNAAASGQITGLFANGTDYAPGGLAVVGERGPELVNLPEGSRVFSNHKSMDMVRGGGNQQNSNMRPILNVHVSGASGDAHVRELARQGAQEVLFQYDQNQTRGGFGQQQQNYAKRKG